MDCLYSLFSLLDTDNALNVFDIQNQTPFFDILVIICPMST